MSPIRPYHPALYRSLPRLLPTPLPHTTHLWRLSVCVSPGLGAVGRGRHWARAPPARWPPYGRRAEPRSAAGPGAAAGRWLAERPSVGSGLLPGTAAGSAASGGTDATPRWLPERGGRSEGGTRAYEGYSYSRGAQERLSEYGQVRTEREARLQEDAGRQGNWSERVTLVTTSPKSRGQKHN